MIGSAPARKIPKNYRNLTGKWFSNKADKLVAFESSLERDFIIMQDIDPSVSSVVEQPVRIIYKDDAGRERSYVPDFQLAYNSNQQLSTLFEVKYRADLFENWSIYKPKFKAALSFAKSHGLKFKLITEREISGVVLENAKFLSNYLNDYFLDEDDLHLEWVSLIESTIQKLGSCTVEQLIAVIANNKWKRAEAIAQIWRLIALNDIHADLQQPLNLNTEIWWPYEIS